MADDSLTPEPKLTVKQKRFADYLLGEARGNASEAARLCGYKDPGNEGWRLRKNAAVRAYMAERLDAEGLTSGEILRELADVGMADWREFVTVKTNPKTGEVVETRMDLGSKVKSLELLGKAHGLFTDKVEEVGSGVRREYVIVRDGKEGQGA